MTHGWIISMAVMAPLTGSLPFALFNKCHSAKRAVARLILLYLRVHGAGVLIEMMFMFHNKYLLTAFLSPCRRLPGGEMVTDLQYVFYAAAGQHRVTIIRIFAEPICCDVYVFCHLREHEWNLLLQPFGGRH
jgi:hypothetical protein